MAGWMTTSGPRSLERSDEIAPAEVDKVKDKSIKRDIPFALLRGTLGQVTTHALDGYARPVRRRG